MGVIKEIIKIIHNPFNLIIEIQISLANRSFHTIHFIVNQDRSIILLIIVGKSKNPCKRNNTNGYKDFRKKRLIHK